MAFEAMRPDETPGERVWVERRPKDRALGQSTDGSGRCVGASKGDREGEAIERGKAGGGSVLEGKGKKTMLRAPS